MFGMIGMTIAIATTLAQLGDVSSTLDLALIVGRPWPSAAASAP